MKDYTEYDMHEAVRALAAKLIIPGEGITDEELFERIEEKCQAAAEIFLEKVFEKDKLRAYLQSSGRTPPSGELIPVDGDAVLEKFLNDQLTLHAELNKAIMDCANRTAN